MSACLLGRRCRFDGESRPNDAVIDWVAEHGAVPVCPEALGGLPCPRTPSEVQPDGCVIDRDGHDRTAAFEEGARQAVQAALAHGCRLAILKSKSPSCGVREVYDGTFSGTLVPGMGKAAAALREAGLELLEETDL